MTTNNAQPTVFPQEILVPFPVESALSGVMKPVSENRRLWYRRTFDIPRDWIGRRIVLNFGAVDFETSVFVNGKLVGKHRGGYDGFSFDVTDSLSPLGQNELVVSVWDPTDSGTQPRGKQVRKPNGIWYTSTSGIWQTVWLEPVGAAHITRLEIRPGYRPERSGPRCSHHRTAGPLHRGSNRARWFRRPLDFEAPLGGKLIVPIKKLRLWSPETPFLYTMTVTLKLGGRTMDRVDSYVGMRKISLGKDAKDLPG